MKPVRNIIGIACLALVFVASSFGSRQAFLAKHPELSHYVLWLTSVDLEIEHEKQKHLDVSLAMGQVYQFVPKDAKIAKRVDRVFELQRIHHEGVLQWFEEIRQEMKHGDTLYMFTASKNGKNESGYLILRDGEIVKRYATESTDIPLR